jgi:hypothetical protein
VRIILRTRCGCTRELLDENIIMSLVPNDIYVPLPPDFEASFDSPALSDAVSGKAPVRRFRLWRHDSKLTEYREVEE